MASPRRPALPPVIKINSDILKSYAVHKLPAKEFVRQFYAAASGETNTLSEFVKPGSLRLPQNQWAAIRSFVFDRDDYTCQYCGLRGGRLECDHVQPLSRGGRNDQDNLLTACYACNRSKGRKTVDEWRRG